MNKKRIYLSGTFHSEKDHVEMWSDMIQSALNDTFDFYVPQYVYSKDRNEKSVSRIVDLMKFNISNSDILLLNFIPTRESIVPCMELTYANEIGLWTCTLDESTSLSHYPWVEYHSDEIFDSVEDVIQYFKTGGFLDDY